MVSSGEAERAAQIAALLDETGRSSALSVLLSQAVADHVGLHPTDVEALDLLNRFGPLSAGHLAELTGLSTGGAITKLIDRLERAGYAQRQPDPADRRRVLVQVHSERALADLGPLFVGLDAAVRALAEEYGEAELAAILDFSVRANQLVAAQIAHVRGLTAARVKPDQGEATSP
jgi:DNA-binding MarR family transcriptional regulator